MLVDAARMWRAEVPETGRLVSGIAIDRKSLTITEVRVTITALRMNEWSAPGYEQGVAVMWLKVSARPGVMSLRTGSMALVNLHALARRVERGRDRSERAMLADLRKLATAAAVREGAVAVVELAEGCCWAGEMIAARDPRGHVEKTLAIRTYLGEHQVAAETLLRRAAPVIAPRSEVLALA